LPGHKEAFDTVPESTALLMTGKVCQVQMFRIGRNENATQFNPEGEA